MRGVLVTIQSEPGAGFFLRVNQYLLPEDHPDLERLKQVALLLYREKRLAEKDIPGIQLWVRTEAVLPGEVMPRASWSRESLFT